MFICIYDSQEKLQIIFKAFDFDKDSFLNSREFQDFAYQLGVLIPNNEITACISEITNDAKLTKIDFDQFANWWRSPFAYSKVCIGSFYTCTKYY